MEGILRVTPQELMNKASEFDTIRTSMMAIIDEMTAKVNSLNGVWEGEAAIAYQEKYSQLSDDIQHLNNIVAEHVTDLNAMSNAYTGSDSNIIDKTSGLPTDIIK